MSSRIFKYEIKSLSKFMIIFTICIVALSAALLTAEKMSIDDVMFKNRYAEIIVALFITVCVYVLVTGLRIAGRFNDILMTDKGYIAFSLPVKNSTHLRVNVIIASVAIAFTIIFSNVVLIISDMITGAGNKLFSVMVFTNELKDGSDMPLFMLSMAMGVFLSAITICINIYMSIIFAIVITNRIAGIIATWRKSDIGIVTFIVLAVVKIIIASLLMYLYDAASLWALDISMSFALSYFIVIAIYLISTILMYIICKNILDKKFEMI